MATERVGGRRVWHAFAGQPPRKRVRRDRLKVEMRRPRRDVVPLYSGVIRHVLMSF